MKPDTPAQIAKINAIPAFQDNYIWVIEQPGKGCCVVDPGDARPVLDWLEKSSQQLTTILLSHQHMDHIGGVEQLVETTGAEVFGPDDPRMPASSQPVSEGSKLQVCGVEFEVLEVPGHTSTHIAFYSASTGVLFCGDTLFSLGCGRIFEGSPEQMLASLDKLATLPDSTQVYCTHEYTQANGKFALVVEPGNQRLIQRCRQVDEMRSNGEASLPSNILLERQTNPFLRCEQAAVIAAARQQNGNANSRLEVFTAIRHWKDNF